MVNSKLRNAVRCNYSQSPLLALPINGRIGSGKRQMNENYYSKYGKHQCWRTLWQTFSLEGAPNGDLGY